MAEKLRKIGGMITLDGEKEYRAALQAIGKEQSVLRSEMKMLSAGFADSKDSVEALTETGKALEEMHEAQERRIETLNGALETAKKEYGENSKQVQDWEIKLNNAYAELYKLDAELAENKEKLDHAAKAADQADEDLTDLSGGLQEVSESADGSGESVSVFSEVLKANLASSAILGGIQAIAGGIKEIGSEAIGLGISGRRGLNQFAASTGTAKEDLGDFRDVMYEVYADNFGESIEDVAESMGEVVRQMGKMDPDNLKRTTEQAMTLQDTFGYDMQEQLRAVNMLVEQFGVTGDEAFNLIVQGAQNGLDKNGDLLDSINEYSVHFEQLGFSAEDMFNILVNGAESGTFSVDKLGDAMKEFGIRTKDGSDTSREAFEALGLDADEMFRIFNEGGESAKEATQMVIEKLAQMGPGVERTTAGVNLFGTMWEDLGVKGIAALGDINGEISTTSSALEELNEIKYDDLGSAMDGITRGALSRFAKGFDEASESAIGDLQGISNEITNGKMGDALEDLGTASGDFVSQLTSIAETILPGIVDGVADLVNGAAGVLSWISGGVEKPKSDLEQFTDEIKRSNEEVEKSLESVKQTRDDALTNIGELEDYKELLLQLNGEEEKDEYTKYRIKKIVGELKEQIPELAAAYDEQTGSINLTNEEITALIKNQEEMIRQNAAMETREVLYKKVFEAELNLVKAKEAVAEAEKQERDFMEMNNASLEKNAGLYGDYEGAVASAHKTVIEAKNAQEEANDVYEAATKELNQANQALEEMGYSEDEVVEKTSELSDAQENMTDVTETAEEEVDSLTSALSAYAEKTGEAEETVRENFDSMAEKYANAYNSAYDSITGQLGLFDQFSGGTAIAAADVLINLQSQVDGMRNWADNLQTLADRGLNEGLIKELQDAGPAMAAQVQELVIQSDQFIGDLNNIWTEKVNLAGGISSGLAEAESGFLAYGQQLGIDADTLAQTLNEKGIQIGSGYIGKFSEGLQNGAPTVASDLDALQGEAAAKVEEYAEDGSKSASGYIDELSSGIGGATVTIGLSLLLISGEALLFETTMKGIGGSTGSGFVNKLTDGMKNGRDPIQRELNEIVSRTRNLSNPLQISGTSAADGLVNGFVGRLNARYNEVSAAAARIQSAVNSGLQIHSPSRLLEESGSLGGEGLILGFREAVEEGMPSIAESALKLGDTASDSLSEWEYTDAPAVQASGNSLPAEQILSLLQIIADNSEKGIYLDNKTLVGRMAPRMDQELSDRARQTGRYL